MVNTTAMRAMPARVTVGLVVAIAMSQTALAADWRYCLAPSNDEHKVYFSGAFATSADAWRSDSEFDQALIRAGLHHDEVQCPRAGDESAIMTMLQDAIAYNRRIGRKIIYVGWEPAN